MKYHEIIHRIKATARADDDSSQDALELVVENVASHLNDRMRRDFAAALPFELQSAAQMVPTAQHLDEDIVEQLMDLEDVDEAGAKRRIKAAWQAICDIFDTNELEDMTAELPRQVVAILE